MTKTSTNSGQWKTGQSGNPKGKTPGSRAISEILRLKGEEQVVVGGQALSAQEALAEAIWRFVLKGDVMLGKKHLQAESVVDWVQAVKWLYTYVDPPQGKTMEHEPEVVVRVVRVAEPRHAVDLTRQEDRQDILTAETQSEKPPP
ncbi:MAG: hypothetical protein H0X30_27750 [Anaerolineae bacterium]|nr:hypothetical protein [Anaerolineae bacterium]